MRVLEVRGCVPIGRAIATANMAAVQADSQVHPAPADLQAIFAARWRSVQCPWRFTRYMFACVRKVDGGVSHAGTCSRVVHSFLTQLGYRVQP